MVDDVLWYQDVLYNAMFCFWFVYDDYLSTVKEAVLDFRAQEEDEKEMHFLSIKNSVVDDEPSVAAPEVVKVTDQPIKEEQDGTAEEDTPLN